LIFLDYFLELIDGVYAPRGLPWAPDRASKEIEVGAVQEPSLGTDEAEEDVN
jgi:hypothetical protein